ncbi:MAG: hypothetical protein ACOY3M_00200 [Patescibacteria group bacterium]
MSKNPVINALSASAYILFIVSVMSWGTQYAPKEDSFLAPVAVISLFTLSAAVMGYIFCYAPLMLYFDGKKKVAVTLFLQTVGVFGLLTAVFMGLLFSGIIR